MAVTFALTCSNEFQELVINRIINSLQNIILHIVCIILSYMIDTWPRARGWKQRNETMFNHHYFIQQKYTCGRISLL